MEAESRRRELCTLAGLFLKLGATAFGGPAAHIAMMEDEVVRRRGWMSREELLDLVGASNLIPGPTSTELAIHIGHRRAGFPGLVVAGAAFILPAVLITSGLAWAYVHFGRLAPAKDVLYGVKPVILGVVVQALAGFGRSALKSKGLVVLAALAVAATLAGVHELVVLAVAGAAAVALRRATIAGPPPPSGAKLGVFPWPVLATAGAAVPPALGLGSLFWVFLKIGSVLFGSGYVLLAFLRADLVERYGWLTEAQLLDAVAAGQITPGPVFSTATFIGYLLAGAPGAAVATVGIFLPAFVFVALSGPLLPRVRRSRLAGAFLDGVNVASLALMAAVTFELGRAAVVDVPTALLALAGAAALLRFRINSAWLVLGGALCGLAVRQLAG